MTSARKIASNRHNARASTGPKTAAGKRRTSRNSFRHGLSIPIRGNPMHSAEVEHLAATIAGPRADPTIREHARRIAEAQIDLLRVRRARHGLLMHRLAEPGCGHFLRTIKGKKAVKLLIRMAYSDQGWRYLKAMIDIEPQAGQKLSFVLRERLLPWTDMSAARFRDGNSRFACLMKHGDMRRDGRRIASSQGRDAFDENPHQFVKQVKINRI